MVHRRLTSTLVLTLAVFISIVAATSAVPVAIPPVPRLAVTIGGSISPRVLPADEYVPVRWHLFGKFGTSDGKHPPALRELEVDVDRDVKLNVRGFPSCHGARLERRSSSDAMAACRDALLGKGRANLEIAEDEGLPTLLAARVLVFNGGRRAGVAKLLIHTFVKLPVPTAIVTRVTIATKATGLHTVARIPVIAAGRGSLVGIAFELGATYVHKGRKVGYFEARCPDEVFKLDVKKLLFKNEAQTPAEGASTQLKGKLAVPCTGKG
jgi:hypothetical protein